MAINPTAPTALPETDGAGGLVNADVNNAQQKGNFSSIWSYLAFLFGRSGDRSDAAQTLLSEGAIVSGAPLIVQSSASVSGDLGAGGSITSGAGIGAKFFHIQQGPNGAVYIAERDFGTLWAIYATGGTLRFWNAVTGDLMLLDSQGNLRVKGDVIAGGL